MAFVVHLRRAAAEDADWLVGLYSDEDVDPFLGPRRPRDRDTMLAAIVESAAEPEAAGIMVIEVDGERAGAMQFNRANEANRIAHLGALAVHPDFRGRRLADEAARML